MGPALNTACAQNAYTLADLGTWLSFRNRGALAVLVAGDPRLFNQYGVMLVNPAKYPHVKAADGQAFIDWLISPEGQKVIGDYKIEGQRSSSQCQPRYGTSLAPCSLTDQTASPGSVERRNALTRVAAL
jgi:ABC-type tungstate transport system permease subunit